jgi:small-conductance mechanosensitive channel
MQNIILFLLLWMPLIGAPIDKAFFQGENVPKYYEQIEKEINSTISQKLKDPKIITLERETLQKLKDLYSQKGEITPVNTTKLPATGIPDRLYLKALHNLAALSLRIEHLQQKKVSFQKKLFELKTKIEKELPGKPENRLLIDQMQYAFYKISKEKITKTLELYNTLYSKEFKRLWEALPKVHFQQTKHAKKILQKSARKIDTLQQKDMLLEIEKASELSPGPKTQKKIAQDARTIQKATDVTVSKKIATQLLMALKAIQSENQEAFLKSIQSVDRDIAALSPQHKERYDALSKIVLEFGEKRFDTASTAIASTQIGLEQITDSILHFVDKTLFVYEEKAFSIRTVLIFLTILFIGLFIAKIYKNFVDRFRRSQRIKSLSTARMIANSGYYLIILTTFFIALKSIGLDMHTIFLVIGAVLLWLAFGLQTFISNYAIGILLKIDRSIRIGDHIELDPKTVGDVDDMDFRSITIRSSDGVRTTIPNSRFLNGTFINHSLEGECRRLEVRFSADKEIDHKEIETKLLSALAQSDLPLYRHAEKIPRVAIVDINRRIVRYALLVWVPKEITYDMTLAQSKFLKFIHTTLFQIQPPV